jgi:predicted RND superfamily exporter protein
VSAAPEVIARRYVSWLGRHAWTIVAGHLVVLGFAIYLIAFRLPLFADFSYLLPQDAPAVLDLRRLEARVQATDVVIVVAVSPTPQERAAVVAEMNAALQDVPKDLVDRVDADDKDVRDFIKAHEYLLAPTQDLRDADAAVKKKLKQAKCKANPLCVSLDDDDAGSAAAGSNQPSEVEKLRDKRRDAEAKLDTTHAISVDGLIGKIEVRTNFRSTDAGRGRALLDILEAARDKVLANHPTSHVGFAGSVIVAVAEHAAILDGMLLSSLVTTVLVALVLALYFRSATLLVLLIASLAIATAFAFGAASLTVGHLNAATAFLGAIIAGNGINYGILLIARFLEERRRGKTVEDALATAIIHTLRPTAVASLGASIAYGSLAATSFKGFADFAVIGAIGMTLCWIASYLLLPALMLKLGRRATNYDGDPVIGTALVRVLGFRRSEVVCAVAAVILIGAGFVVARYVADDPFEYDIKRLRSEGDDAVTARDWMRTSDVAFGRGYSGRTIIAADDLADVPEIVTALRAIDKGKPEPAKTIGDIQSILDLVPRDQAEKLALIADLRKMLADKALQVLDDKQLAAIDELRPPPDVKPITYADLPAPVRQAFTEKDGRIGYLISIRPADKLDEWNGRDMVRFADAVRELHLASGKTITTSGSSVIFADILESIRRDGPLVTSIAAGGLVIMVVLLVGRNRRAAAVLLATVSGSLLMTAICALLELRVNFLDFVALPITLGLGVDYAINVAHRHDHEEVPDPLTTLRTSGSAVFVCSLTTIIGYGSLLVSDNLAIRGFGTASLIGEVTCLLTALVLVPAVLAVGRRRPTAHAVTDHGDDDMPAQRAERSVRSG